MNRPFTALYAFLDALTAAVLGIGVLLVPLTIVWIAQFQLGVDYRVFWNVAANFWLLGNGVDLLVTVDPTLALRLALTSAGIPFEIGFAPLGFALLTVLLAYRSGGRFSEAPHRLFGVVIGVLGTAVLGGLVGLTSSSAAAAPSMTQSMIFPAVFYALGMMIGLYSRPVFTRVPSKRSAKALVIEVRLLELLSGIPSSLKGMLGLAIRGGAIAVSGIMVIAGVIVSLLVLGNYGTIIGFYEQLQTGIVGGVPLTLFQLAVIPNLVIWAASWLIGPGFQLGTGTLVSPLGTEVGLLPSLPILGALPTGSSPLGFFGLIVPIIIGFAVGVLLRPRLTLIGEWAGSAILANPIARLLIAAIGVGAVGATISALLAMCSGGAAGPGRFVDVGPDPWTVWLWLLIELTLSCFLGLAFGLVGRHREELDLVMVEDSWEPVDGSSEPSDVDERNKL